MKIVHLIASFNSPENKKKVSTGGMAAGNYLVVQGLISDINTYIFLYQLQLVFKPMSCIESLHMQEKNSLQN
jgi:hypothetical protein